MSFVKLVPAAPAVVLATEVEAVVASSWLVPALEMSRASRSWGCHRIAALMAPQWVQRFIANVQVCALPAAGSLVVR